MNKYLIHISLLSLLLYGCVGKSGRIESTTLDPNSGKLVKAIYSKYWEDIQFSADKSVKTHTMITLGNERVPEGYQTNDKIRLSQGEILGVLEVYLTNISTNTVDVQVTSIQEYARLYEINQKSVQLAPADWEVTEPIIERRTIYGTKDIPYEIQLSIDGKTETIKGNLHRLTVNELKQKYGN